ncbi:hypothetical protein [Aquimarina sp. 2201CG5-10]|uniref:hypothetical protein n=1 Tax=Aquimarina callyspongiae TaxID=3098150 RepID=UPI002AB375F5|nr:hypothetical protein [Aquimarina sp. 2201CG5-10]MDY8136556.1 hypothetical protein [Aquimarina sp. 2201CG5-10]
MKSIIAIVLVAIVISSCSKESTSEEVNAANEYLELVGTVEHRTASEKELSALKKPTTRANCTLHGDEGCSDDSRSEFERYVRECTTYPRTWPPSGTVSTYYKSMIYYVDGDGDINLDHYQDDLQAHVDQIISSVGSAAFISANIVFWQCNERENNSCVLQYTVYR